MVPVARVAEMLGVAPRTIRRWVSQHRIRACRTAPDGSGRLLIVTDSLRAMLGGAS